MGYFALGYGKTLKGISTYHRKIRWGAKFNNI
jgi:hypothetical protein